VDLLSTGTFGTPTTMTLCALLALGLAVLAHLIRAISEQLGELWKIRGTDPTKR
jgi:hypothetical protein